MIEYELMLKIGDLTLPEETRCIACDIPTEDIAYTLAVCEESTSTEPSLAKKIFTIILYMAVAPIHLGLFLIHGQDEDIRHGRNINFNLPLRLCAPCRRGVWNHQVRQYVLKVPLYHRLLEKYPHTKLSRLKVEP